MTKCMTRFAVLALLLALGCGDEGDGTVRAGPTAGTGSTGDTAGPGDTADTVGVGATGGLFLDGFFPIGTYQAYPTQFQMHKDRGVNTLVVIPDTFEGDSSQPNNWEYPDEEWDALAVAGGFKVIRRPMNSWFQTLTTQDLIDDAALPHLLAWSHNDEPDVAVATNGNYTAVTTAEDKYSTWHAAAPSQPVFITFGGGNMLNPSPYDCNGMGDEGGPYSDCYDRFIAATDWIANDIYPVNGWLWDEGTRDDISQVGLALDKIRGYSPWSQQWSDGPLFAYIEGARFDTAWGSQYASPEQTRAEIWNAIIHEARGIVYFTLEVAPGFTWDNMTPDVETEVTYQNGIITQLAPVLQDVINPSSLSATMSSASLEAGWRDTPSGKYFFVLNKTENAVNGATVTLTGIGDASSATVFDEARSAAIVDGVITDDFPAFERHIYVVTP